MVKDTILCNNKREAKEAFDNIGAINIDDWEFQEDGKVLIKLNCSVNDLKKCSCNE